MKTLLLAGVVAFVVACSATPPPDWQMTAKGSAERAAEAWLSGNDRVEQAEFGRARSEVARTGRPGLVARVELLRCATRVAALVIEPCVGFAALAPDAAPAEQAYARYLQGKASVADGALLPQAHRAMLGTPASPEVALAAVADPLSRLVAAGVLLQRGQASPAVIALAMETASARGWRRPLLAWLTLAQQRAAAAGATEDIQRLQRRLDVLLQSSSR